MSILIGVIPTAILFIIAIVHFSSHFTVNIPRCCSNNTPNFITPRQSSLAFYPSLWTIYLSYLLLLCISIILIQIGTFPTNTLTVYIICHGIILSSCWESLFSFHRYCTLKQYMQYSRRMKTKLILKKFTLFASVYVILFVSQLHFIYWLFPATISMYVLCNVYWQYQFIQMLLKQYSTLSTFDTVAASNIQDTMIRSVYIMGYCSISSTIISSLSVFSLCVFCAFDTNYIHINFIQLDHNKYNLVSIYFPLFWCCSSFFYMFNFVRNRSLFKRHFTHIYSIITQPNDPSDTDINITPPNSANIATKIPTITATVQNISSDKINSKSNTNIPAKKRTHKVTSDTISSYNTENIAFKPKDAQHTTPNQSGMSTDTKTISFNGDKFIAFCPKCKSDITDFDADPTIKPSLCLAPPTSFNSDHLDDISSEDVDYDYKLSLDSSQDTITKESSPGIAIRIPVVRHKHCCSHADSVTTDSSGYISNSMISPKQPQRPYILANINENKSVNSTVPLSVINDNNSAINNHNQSPCKCNCNCTSDDDRKGIIISIHRYNSNQQLTSYIVQHNEIKYPTKHKGIVIVRDNSESEQSVVIERVGNKKNGKRLFDIYPMNKCKSVPIGIVDSVSSHSTDSNDAMTKILRHCEECKLYDDEDIVDCYKECERNKSHALTDMMVNYGWTDKSLLCSLQGLKRSLSR